jgi:rhamnose utilization protein RhaD (predicted bifunctional aldolase and dehydrogenase)
MENLRDMEDIIKGRSGMNRDTDRTSGDFMSNVEEKYISRIFSAANEHKKMVQAHPTREIMLLQTLKAFSGDASQKSFDNIIDIISTLNAARSIDQEIYGDGGLRTMESDEDAAAKNSAKMLMIMALLLGR